MPPADRILLLRQRAIELLVEVYRCTSQLPPHERTQLRKIATSLLRNPVETHSPVESFPEVLTQARNSLPEMETQINVAYGQCYLSHEQVMAMLSKTGELFRIVNGILAAKPDHRSHLAGSQA